MFLDLKKRLLLGKVTIATRGFILVNENEELIKELETFSYKVISKYLKENGNKHYAKVPRELNYKKALNVLDNMIQYCTASGSIDEVALVAKEKAICESKLGYMEQTKETVLNSYYALKAMKLYRAAECLKSYAAKYLKLEFHATYMIGE